MLAGRRPCLYFDATRINNLSAITVTAEMILGGNSRALSNVVTEKIIYGLVIVAYEMDLLMIDCVLANQSTK